MLRRRLIRIVVLILCAGMTANVLAANDSVAPEGINYVSASDAANKLAMSELKTAFSGNKIQLGDLISKGVKTNGHVLLGVYLSQIIANSAQYVNGSFAGGEYQIPLDEKQGVIIHAKLLSIVNEKQVSKFNELLNDNYKPSKSITIRKLTKDEMELIWFYISWNLVEPIYVVKDGDTKLVFEFDPSGSSLQWIEDITEPCFHLAIGSGGLPCMCQLVVHKNNLYQSVFKPMSECQKYKNNGPGE